VNQKSGLKNQDSRIFPRNFAAMSPTTTIDDVLHHLLMEEAQICLPGLGTLRRTAQPALVSPLEGKALPPSGLVNFNVNLVLDDGRLLRALEAQQPDDKAEAKRMLDDFLRNMQENLDAGRSFTIDRIGRFFKHFDGQIRFTPTGDNFSKESFGLPAIDLRPIVRTEKQRRASVDPLLADPASFAPATAPESAVKQRRQWFRRPESDPTAAADKESLLYNEQLRSILWYVFWGMAALLLLVLIYNVSQYFLGLNVDASSPLARTERPRLEVPNDRINVAPPPRPVDAEEVAPGDPPRLNDPKPTTPDASYEQAAPTENIAPTEKAAAGGEATSTGDNVALIATGMFGSQRNVEKNLDRIKAAGFDTFTKPEGQLTRIGARLEYQTEEELDLALERLRRLYSDAFVTEINGVVKIRE
jgi:cell division septation protein DedD